MSALAKAQPLPSNPSYQRPEYSERTDKRSRNPSRSSLQRAWQVRSKREREKNRLITASELCDRTGLTKTEFRKLVNRGLIRSCARNQANWTLYHEDDVARIHKLTQNRVGVVSRREGLFADQCEYTAHESHQVFALLSQGVSLTDIHLRVRLHPVIILAVQRDWARMHGAMIVPLDVIEEINKLPLEGTFPITTPKELYDILLLASQEKKCGQCKVRPIAHTCLACTKKSLYQARRSGARDRTGRPVEADGPTFAAADEDLLK